MNRIISSVILTLFITIFISCSGASNLSQDGSANTSSKYPSWYPQQSIVKTDSVIHSYATAIDDDSAAAVSKAVAWAESELQASLSNTLEDIRTEAASESSAEGLDDPNFIMALRNAENVVDEIASTQKTEVRTVEGYESVRSFAGVTVDKEELIESIGDQLSDYKKTWNAMKESQAFQEF